MCKGTPLSMGQGNNSNLDMVQGETVLKRNLSSNLASNVFTQHR